MKAKPAIALVAILQIFSGCTAPVNYFSAIPGLGQRDVAVPQDRTRFGLTEIRSGIQLEVIFTPTLGNELYNGTATFWVFAKNVAREPFLFSRANISVEDYDGKPVPLFTMNEMARKLQANKSRQEWGVIILSSLASALEAAPYMTNRQTGTFSGVGPNGQYVTGSYIGTQQNSTVAYLAQQQNTARINAYKSEAETELGRALESIDRLSLGVAKLEKSHYSQGMINVPLPRKLPNRYRIIVSVEGMEFRFDFPIRTTP